MRRISRTPVVLFLIAAATLLSCNNNKYGKRIKVEGTNSEIFYKDGISETEARKVAAVLKEEGFLKAETASTIQVTNEDSDYAVRFVYDKDYYEKNGGFEKDFREYALKISKDVFNGKKVDIVLADTLMKDFTRIPFEQPKPVETDLAPAAPPAGLADKEKDEFDHDSLGGVNFYWKGISDQESKKIAAYIVENGAFNGGTVEIYMTKEGDRYILQFPVKEEYRTDPSYIAEVEKVAKQIKDNVFASDPYSFQMTDEKLSAVKSFDY